MQHDRKGDDRRRTDMAGLLSWVQRLLQRQKDGRERYLAQERLVNDRRSLHVKLTDKGHKLRDRLSAMHERHITSQNTDRDNPGGSRNGGNNAAAARALLDAAERLDQIRPASGRLISRIFLPAGRWLSRASPNSCTALCRNNGITKIDRHETRFRPPLRIFATLNAKPQRWTAASLVRKPPSHSENALTKTP
jgi:DNA-binding MarR family transcriptional regulator